MKSNTPKFEIETSKQEQLDAIAHEIIYNNVCPDLRDGAIQLVKGSGNPDADIVFIGEAPGKKEDEQGAPFLGAAGKLLNKMLDSVEMDRDDVYITNIVKYRPPKNRDPSTEEKAELWPYLVRELEVIKPKIVIALGRHSMEYFLPGRKIGDVHGQSEQVKIGKNDFTVVPLYHPAAALYNGGLLQTLMDDFAEVAKVSAQQNLY